MFHTYMNFCNQHLLKAILYTSLFAMMMQIVVDAYLGPVAEYFNAWYVLRAFAASLTGASPLSFPFLMGQEALGLMALPAATVILILEPMLYGSMIVFFVRKATPNLVNS